MEESKLVELAKSGDRQALAQLVKNNEQTVYNFSFKICRDRDKAEHIMQETFYSMIKSLHQFDGNSKISTWLYRIVSNHCLMLARKDKTRTFVSIDKLSPEYRIVFLLRDVEGLSTEETAELTELSVPAVKSRLHRARAFLRKELNEAFSR